MSVERQSNSTASPYCYPGLFTQTELQAMLDNGNDFVNSVSVDDRKSIVLNSVKVKLKIDYKILYGKPSKKRDFVTPRFWYIFFLKKYTSLTLKSIGDIFDIKCHSTIKNAIRKINNLIDTESESKTLYLDIDNLIRYKIFIANGNLEHRKN